MAFRHLSHPFLAVRRMSGIIALQPVIGRVTVRVLSPRGVPVEGARATLISSEGTRGVNADATGAYRFDQIRRARAITAPMPIAMALRI